MPRAPAAYERAMRERTRLLGEGGDPPGSSRWKQQWRSTGVAIAASRRETVARLAMRGRFRHRRLPAAGARRSPA